MSIGSPHKLKSIPHLKPILQGSEGRVDGTELDVRVDDAGRGVVGLDVGGGTAAGGAGAARIVRADRVGGVEPQHVGVVVVPQAHDEDHAIAERLTHALEASHRGEDIGVVSGGLLGSAVVGGDGVARDTSHVGLGVGNGLAVLDVEALDLAQVAGVVGQELGDNGEDLGGVDTSGTSAVE